MDNESLPADWIARRLCSITRPQCLKEYTFGTVNSRSNLRLGKIQVATRYNYPVLGANTHTVAVAETYAYQGKEGRASKRDTQVFFNTAAVEGFTQGFTYDDLGNTASLNYPQCTHAGCAPEAASPKTVTFAYTEGLLTAVPGFASPITYHSNQTIAQVTHVNGITDVIGIDPNAQQRPASILARNAGGTNLWNAGTYLYDGTGNVKSIGGSGFAYDPASRLITANLWDGTGATGTPLKTQTYGYDLFGNLQAIGGLGGRNTPTSSTTNRLNGAGMAYDAAGNQTNNNGAAVHEYDPFHLMWHFQSGAEDWRYVYTADDERIWSFKSGGGGGSRWTLRDLGNNVLREYANNGGVWSVKEDFIHRGGQLLAADTATGVSHFHLDHLGTPRLVTNQSGVKTAYHVYWPYGEELTSATQDAERMKFTGHERDLNGAGGAGDDLDYMHARFCSPVTGRFLSTDPVLDTRKISTKPQRWNRYAYVSGNPLRAIDPDGRDEFSIMQNLSGIEDDPSKDLPQAGFLASSSLVVGGGAFGFARALLSPVLAEAAFAVGVKYQAFINVLRDLGAGMTGTPRIVIPGPTNSAFGKLDYLLDNVPGNPASSGKGGFFGGVLGFTDHKSLGGAITAHLADNLGSAVTSGTRVTVTAQLTGPNGVVANVKSVWQLVNGTYRFITAVPASK